MNKIVFTQEMLNYFKEMVLDETVSKQQVEEEFGISSSKVETLCRELGIKGVWTKLCNCCVCGKEFRAKKESMICPECKEAPATCVICGKEFKRVHPYNQKTCSPKCRGIYRKESGIAKEGGAKMKQTKMERYGTLDPADIAKAKKGGELDPKECPLCHKMFIPNTPRQIYCTDTHYVPCPVCGKMTELKDVSTGPQACSEECRMQRIYATNIERYGNKDAVNSEYAKKLARKTSLEKYGVEYYRQSEEAKQHYKDVIKERYGVESPLQHPQFKEKSKQTNLKKYGVEYASQNPEIKKKVKETNEKLYGGMGLASPELRKRVTKTNLKKYGVKYVVQSPVIKEKIRQANRTKYNVDNFWSSKDHLSNIILDPSKIDEYFAFKQDPKMYVESHYDIKPDIYTLASDLGVTDTPIYDILIKADCKDVIDHTKMSSMERQMHKFLQSIVPNAKIILNDRTQIKPQELDFYLPEYKFAIECNPTITHNSTVGSWDENDVKPYNYHQIKSKLCQDKGIFLMHVFGFEWKYKREIIESMIRNALKCNATKIYARKTIKMKIF